MPVQFIRSHHTWVSATCLAAAGFAIYFVSYYPISTFWRAASLWAASAVVVLYGPWAIKGLRDPNSIPADLLGALGLMCIAVGFVVTAMIVVFYRITVGNLPIMSKWTVLALAFQTIGMVLMVIAPRRVVPQLASTWSVLVAFGVAALMTAVVFIVAFGVAD